MGIVDLFRPKHRHSDVRVRTEFVRGLTAEDADLLEQIARTDRDLGVRRLAIEKIASAEVLSALYDKETERSLRQLINERATELWIARACVEDADTSGAALTGIVKLGDQRALVEVVVRAHNAGTRKRAFGELRDPRSLAELAKSDAAQDLRIAAVARIDDGDVLRALAIDTTQKEVGLAAVEKLDDADRLENVAQKAKNKAVRQKARKIVGEIERAEAERTKAPGVPDEVKRRRAEKVQLIREIEAVADSFDFAKVAEQVSALEVAWMKLGADDGDERFTRAAERFWKRKELHESTARSADELRAIEREAARERARAAAERTTQAAEPEPVREPESEEARVAREAEATARREERERQRVEDEERRAAQAAEREARQKEDAERGAALAASLETLCTEMELLVAGDGKDQRAIERVLVQATKSFEGIGKVPADKRDTLADRYRDARGKLVIKQSELREAEDWLRWTNVPKAEAVIDTAKQMAEAPATPDLGNRLRQLQALWKEIGPMPQRRSKELWDTFKQTCDLVYEKVKTVRAVENEKFAEVIKAKEALIAEAEALAESTEPSQFGATAEKLKGLQAQWKQSGHLPRKQGDDLWKRFRTACDKFFDRRKPMLEARSAEEAENLARKHALIARAQAVATAAGEGTWGKAIGEIKDLQAAWKEIGYVPRRDADTVYKAFRAACDALFAKRDAARDSEANAHRAEIDAVKAEIDAVMAGGDDVVARAIAVRAKARELGVLGTESVAMVQHLIATHPDAIKGTELDPAQLRARREKLIARAEELIPKQPAAPDGSLDVAAQLKAAMQKNAFGDLRFSGRDPVEVIDELRASWAEVGPILDDEDRAQVERFEDITQRVLDAAGVRPSDDDREGGRRRRRDRGGAPPSLSSPEPAAIAGIVATPEAIPERSPVMIVPDAAASALSAIASPEEVTEVSSSVPVSTHDAVTQPARLPPELPLGMPSPTTTSEVSASPRSKSPSIAPPMEEIDTGWDMGDDDPTASKDEAADETSTPSSNEMAGDGSVEGDGLDQVD